MNGAPDRIFTYSDRGGGYTLWVERTLQACLGEAQPPVTGDDGLTALRIVHTAYRSAELGRTLKVDE